MKGQSQTLFAVGELLSHQNERQLFTGCCFMLFFWYCSFF